MRLMPFSCFCRHPKAALLLAATFSLLRTGMAAEPALPQIPETIFRITDYGAVAGGTIPATEAFRKAFAACAKAGGGRVVVPAGVFLTGPMEMAPHSALVLEKGATVRASQTFDDYKLEGTPGESTVFNEAVPLVRPFVWARDVTDVAVLGPGTIDGAGAPWWAIIRSAKSKSFSAQERAVQTQSPRPRLLLFTNCKRVLVQGVELKDAPNFFLVPYRCEEVTIQDAKIHAPGKSPNTDGIDPYCSRNVLIRRCVIDVGDDNIAFKSSEGNPPLENVVVSDCTFLHGHGASVGSNLGSGLRNISVINCTFDGTTTAIRIKSARDRGNVVENILYRDIKIKNVGTALQINLYYVDPREADHPQAQPVTATTPILRNIRIVNVTCESAKHAGEIIGLPESPITGLVMKNVHITADKSWTTNSLRIQDTKGLVQDDVVVTAAAASRR